MSVKNCEKLEKSMVKLTVEVSAADFEAAVEKAYRKQRGKISMPGFRPGKAPRKMIEKMYGAESSEKSLAMRFEGIIKRACRQEGQRVAILVDEYDKPMLQAIGNDALQKSFRNTLNAFYGALKSQDGSIRFALLTGVTKFGKVCVFSDLNNLDDISMWNKYA